MQFVVNWLPEPSEKATTSRPHKAADYNTPKMIMIIKNIFPHFQRLYNI